LERTLADLIPRERKRAQIGTALWQEPEVLAIDEPTNHIDIEEARVNCGGITCLSCVGLLVSHDRDLLDSLCQQCLFVEPPTVIARPGGVTKGLQIDRQEQQTLQKQQLQKKQEYNRLHREAVKRRELAQQADKRRSKRGIAKKDHDAKAKINQARVTGKDAVGGKLLRQLDGRLQQARSKLNRPDSKKNLRWASGFRSEIAP
jgi:ATPase subunit of ABC transporter with duplicated ATPase domains